MVSVAYQSGGSYDWFSTPVSPDSSVQTSRAVRDFRNIVTVEDVAPQPGANFTRGVVKHISVLVQNLNGGLNRVRGTMRTAPIPWPYSDLDRMASGSADVSEPGVCTLPLKTTYQTRINGATPGNICGVNIFSRCVVSMGGAANFALWKENNITDPTLVAITYSPGSNINALDKGIIGGATRAENLMISRKSAAIHVLSDITTGGPTVYGTMHANTSPAFGVCVVPLTASAPGVTSLLIYANNSLYLLASTAAVGDAPTATLTNIPNGGYFVKRTPIKVGSRPDRVYMVLPNQDIASGACMLDTPGSEVKGHLISVNMEGTDPQPVVIPGMEEGIYWAIYYNNSIVVSDGIRIVEIKDDIRDLKWVEQREGLLTQSAGAINSDVQYRVGNLAVYQGSLYVLAVQKNVTTATATYTGLEKYRADTGAWLPVNFFQNPEASLGSNQGENLLGKGFNYNSPGSMPCSDTTGRIFFTTISDGLSGGAGLVDLFHKYLPPEGYSPFWLNRQTASAGATTGEKFDSPATYTSPALLIEGFEGKPIVPFGVECLGDIAAGGSDATVQYAFGTESAQSTWTFSSNATWTFNSTDRLQTLKHCWPNNTDASTRVKYQITTTQGSNGTTDLYKAPNALPFIFHMLVFTDGRVRSPVSVFGPEYLTTAFGAQL